MSKLFTVIAPILPGKEDEWKQWIQELNTTYRAEYVASRKKLQVRERSFLQHTPMGDMIIITLEGENPEEAFAHFVSEKNAFTDWFAAGVKSVHGIDLSQPPPGPMPELVADSGSL